MIDRYGWYEHLPAVVRRVTDPLLASEYEREGYHQFTKFMETAHGRVVKSEELFDIETEYVPFLLAQVACSLAYVSGNPEALARIVYGTEALRSQLDPREWGFTQTPKKREVVFAQRFPLRGKGGSNSEVTARAVERLTGRFRVLLDKDGGPDTARGAGVLTLSNQRTAGDYGYLLRIEDPEGELWAKYLVSASEYLSDVIPSQLDMGLREADQSHPIVLIPDHEHEGFFASPAMLLYGKQLLGEFLAKWSPELVETVDAVKKRFDQGEIRGVEHFELPLHMGNYTREVKFEIKPSRDADGEPKPLLTFWGVDLPRSEEHEKGQSPRRDFEELFRDMPVVPPL